MKEMLARREVANFAHQTQCFVKGTNSVLSGKDTGKTYSNFDATRFREYAQALNDKQVMSALVKKVCKDNVVFVHDLK